MNYLCFINRNKDVNLKKKYFIRRESLGTSYKCYFDGEDATVTVVPLPDKNHTNDTNTRSEIKNIIATWHPIMHQNIIKLFEFHMDQNFCYLFTESTAVGTVYSKSTAVVSSRVLLDLDLATI